jgi:hypothetical protein
MSQKLQIPQYRRWFLAKCHKRAGKSEADGNHDGGRSRRQSRQRQPGEGQVHELDDNQPGG